MQHLTSYRTVLYPTYRTVQHTRRYPCCISRRTVPRTIPNGIASSTLVHAPFCSKPCTLIYHTTLYPIPYQIMYSTIPYHTRTIMYAITSYTVLYPKKRTKNMKLLTAAPVLYSVDNLNFRRLQANLVTVKIYYKKHDSKV